MKKKCIIALTIVGVMALLIVVGIKRYIASGTSTPEAENFNNFLTSYEWRSSSDKGAGFMNFGTDGSFNYRGTDDGNGPWGYNLYDRYEYNSIMNKIIVTDEDQTTSMKVLDYNLNYLALEIEGYRVEFNGYVKEANSRFDFYRGEESYIKDCYGACNILKKHNGEIEFTMEGWENNIVRSIIFTLADKVKYEELVVTAIDDGNDIAEHRDISEEEAEELLGEEGYTEFIWCDEQGFVEKILFYRFYENDGEVNNNKDSVELIEQIFNISHSTYIVEMEYLE